MVTWVNCKTAKPWLQRLRQTTFVTAFRGFDVNDHGLFAVFFCTAGRLTNFAMAAALHTDTQFEELLCDVQSGFCSFDLILNDLFGVVYG